MFFYSVLQTNYIKSSGFGGVMLWSLDLDDFRGTACQPRGSQRPVKYPLLKAVNKALGIKQKPKRPR